MRVINLRVCPARLYTTNVSRTSESISRYNSKYLERIQYEAAPVYTRECETVGGNNFCGFLELAQILCFGKTLYLGRSKIRAENFSTQNYSPKLLPTETITPRSVGKLGEIRSQ